MESSFDPLGAKASSSETRWAERAASAPFISPDRPRMDDGFSYLLGPSHQRVIDERKRAAHKAYSAGTNGSPLTGNEKLSTAEPLMNDANTLGNREWVRDERVGIPLTELESEERPRREAEERANVAAEEKRRQELESAERLRREAEKRANVAAEEKRRQELESAEGLQSDNDSADRQAMDEEDRRKADAEAIQSARAKVLARRRKKAGGGDSVGSSLESVSSAFHPGASEKEVLHLLCSAVDIPDMVSGAGAHY